jgi:lysophospholipase L1-like esterase
MPKVRMLQPQDLLADDAPALNDFYPVLLADGDSWFALSSVPAHNLLEQLDFGTHGAVINLASPGGTLAAREKSLQTGAAHRRIDQWAPGFARFVQSAQSYPVHAIVLSAGGNDLVDALPHVLNRKANFAHVDPAQPDAALDAQALRRFDEFIRASVTGLVRFVREHGGPNATAPIFCHTYDFPTPNNAPATKLGSAVGTAWLYPCLAERKVPAALCGPLIDHLMRHLAATLKSVRLPDFHVVSTLDTITRAHPGATFESGDWDNELHPNTNGYRKLARKLAQAISGELGVQERAVPHERTDDAYA